MTQFMKKSFTVGCGGDQAYRDNHDRIFAKKDPPAEHGIYSSKECERASCSICRAAADAIAAEADEGDA